VAALPLAEARAPGLFALLRALTHERGTTLPEVVAVGTERGFFVTALPVLLHGHPDAAPVPAGGRTLYLPLIEMAALGLAELRAVLAHELAHFSGEDPEYSRRFQPLYAGLGEGAEAIWRRRSDWGGTLVDRPFERAVHPHTALAVHAFERLGQVVAQWSRLRELAADRAVVDATLLARAARPVDRADLATMRALFADWDALSGGITGHLLDRALRRRKEQRARLREVAAATAGSTAVVLHASLRRPVAGLLLLESLCTAMVRTPSWGAAAAADRADPAAADRCWEAQRGIHGHAAAGAGRSGAPGPAAAPCPGGSCPGGARGGGSGGGLVCGPPPQGRSARGVRPAGCGSAAPPPRHGWRRRGSAPRRRRRRRG
jgi:hypothetical protein